MSPIKLIKYLLLILTVQLLPQKGDTLKNRPDSLAAVIRTDTLNPLYIKPIDETSLKIDYTLLNFKNYRNFPEMAEVPGISYVRSLGYPNQNSLLTIYGASAGDITFTENGTPLNNRFTNSLLLPSIQEENVTELEILPLPRGFLYGSNPNSAAVNINPVDFVTTVPYSRIKYYEGPVGEGFLDVRFNIPVFKKLYFFANVSNKKSDEGYLNSDLSIWQTRFQLKYLASPALTINASYYYSKIVQGLNGGVNYDSVLSLVSSVFRNSTFNDVFFDERAAPVNFISRYQKDNLHRASVTLIGKTPLFEESYISLYYENNLNEYRNNEDSLLSPVRIFYDREYSATGIFANISKRLGFAGLRVFGGIDYNTRDLNTFAFSGVSKFYVSGILRFDLADNLWVSGFAKTFSVNNVWFNGFGGDLGYSLDSSLRFYSGAAYFDSYDPLAGTTYRSNNVKFQGGVKLSIESWEADLKIFKSVYDVNYPTGGVVPTETGNTNIRFSEDEYNYNGAGFSVVYKPDNFRINAAAGVILSNNQSGKKSYHPYNFDIGVTYSSYLFDSSLNLKATASFTYRSLNIKYIPDFYNQRMYSDPSADYSRDYMSLDLFVAGRIQEAATLYFGWENILGRQQYLLPYYPELPRNIRFGISWEFLN